MSTLKIEAYLKELTAERKKRLSLLLDTIESLYPDAIISMKYKMPTYESDKGWIAAANQKNYISLYTCSADHIKEFKRKHPEIKTGTGCINFKDSDAIPIGDLKPVIKRAMESGHR